MSPKELSPSYLLPFPPSYLPPFPIFFLFLSCIVSFSFIHSIIHSSVLSTILPPKPSDRSSSSATILRPESFGGIDLDAGSTRTGSRRCAAASSPSSRTLPTSQSRPHASILQDYVQNGEFGETVSVVHELFDFCS